MSDPINPFTTLIPPVRKTLLIKFNKALDAAEMPEKRGSNPRFPQSKYIMLEDALVAVKKACATAGLRFYTVVSYDAPTQCVKALNVFVDDEGSELDFGWQYLPCSGLDPQAGGSAFTYVRRYSVLPLFNFCDDDDDAEDAQGDHDRGLRQIPGARSAHTHDRERNEDGPPAAPRPRGGLAASRTGVRPAGPRPRSLEPEAQPATKRAEKAIEYSEEEIEWAKLCQTLKGSPLSDLTTDQLTYIATSFTSYIKQGEATGRSSEARAAIRGACMLLGRPIPESADDIEV